MTKSGMRPEPQRGILDIEAYVGGRASADGAGKVYKLSANETPLGPSPKAREAFLSAADSLALYPDGGSDELRNAISKRYGLAADRIVCGAGSDELLHLLAQSYLGEGDEAISTEHGFLVYPIVTKAAGATSVVVKEKNLRTDVDAILAALHCMAKRPADEAKPDQRHTLEVKSVTAHDPDAFLPMNSASAATTSRFASSEPTVSRRQSGRP